MPQTESTAANNKRIAKNTIALYIRMILLLLISLYTSRVILESLGAEDFGIYNIVGGLVAFIGFFMSSLINASQRYINVGLGKNDEQLTRIYFRQSFTILFLVSLLVIIASETFGIWFVMNKLVIPESRHFAAFWVFQFSLISIVCAIIQVNFLATIIAYEKMTMYAYFGLIEGFTKLGIAFILIYSSSDHLILFGALSAANSIIILLFHVLYCKTKFNICSLRFIWKKSLVLEMIKFISSNLFGCFAWSVGIQGTNIILNIFFGPIVNAARGIALQISSIVNKFTDSVMTAVKPQIIKSYTRGDIEYMQLLIMKSSKLAFFISVLIAMPVLFETDYILKVWLNHFPDYTIEFSRLIIIETFAQVLITPLWMAANATGNIKRNQIYGRIFTLMSLPLSYISLLLFNNPVIAMAMCTLMNYFYWCYCVYDIKKQINLNIRKYIKSVVFPSITIISSLLIVGICFNSLYRETGFIHFITTTFVLECFGLIVVFLLLTKGEKQIVNNAISKCLNKRLIR